MIRLLALSKHSFCSQPRVPSIEEVRESWDYNSQLYDSFAYCPQTFYYSLTNMMRLHQAHSILEVACGSGTLLPLMLQHKRPETYYLATDLSPNMVALAKNNLKRHFSRYQSKLAFEDWLKLQNLELKDANAEQPIETERKFDRIICNMGLMLTPDAGKILKNLHSYAQPGCLFGVSIWGSMAQTTMITTLLKSMKECGIDPPPQRSNFHLYQKVPALAKEAGWEVLVGWEQNAPFPVIDEETLMRNQLFDMQLKRLSEEQRAKVKDQIHQNVGAMLREQKVLNFAAEVLILKKAD